RANVYDYALLTRLAATHTSAPSGFPPFVAPPAALLAARPLTWLPYEVARGVWLALLLLAALGTALCLAHALGAALKRRPASAIPHLLAAPVVSLGRLRIAALPVAVAAGLLLLALPSTTAGGTGQPTLLSVLLLALALDLAAHRRPVAAGLALALASVLHIGMIARVPVPLAALLAGYALLLGARALAPPALPGAPVVVLAPLVALPGAPYARVAPPRGLGAAALR